MNAQPSHSRETVTLSATREEWKATDRIVKAAVELRDQVRAAVGPIRDGDTSAVQAVIDAVDGAGL